jgi:hypothetical protein
MERKYYKAFLLLREEMPLLRRDTAATTQCVCVWTQLNKEGLDGVSPVVDGQHCFSRNALSIQPHGYGRCTGLPYRAGGVAHIHGMTLARAHSARR